MYLGVLFLHDRLLLCSEAAVYRAGVGWLPGPIASPLLALTWQCSFEVMIMAL